MPEPQFFMKRGDTASAIASTLEDGNQNPVDIQGANIRFKMQPIAGGPLAIDDDALNTQNGDGTDGTMGQVQYEWPGAAGDAGLYMAEWEVTYAGGAVQSFPNGGYLFIRISEDLPVVDAA